MKNLEEDRFVAVFEKEKGNDNYKLYSVGLAEYDREMLVYVFKTGPFAGYDNTSFDTLLSSSPDDLLEEKNNIQIVKCAEEHNKAIYVFPNSYIENFKRNRHISNKSVYLLLSKKILSTMLCETDDNEILITKKFNDIKIDNKTFLLRVKDMLEEKEELNENEKIESKLLEIAESENSIISEENKIPLGAIEKKKIDIEKIISEISSNIVGQEKAISDLVTNIYYNQVLIDKLSEIDSSILDSSKISILLEGATGTGKTAIAKEISTKFDLPIVMRSANSFSETGYVGPTITDLLRKLYFVASKDIEKAERGIIFLDEVDKIASNSTSEEKDMKKGVQEELLGFISGGEYDVPLDQNGNSGKFIRFDTSKLTFILSGAWTKLREKKIREADKKNRTLGFSSVNTSNNERTYSITAQDYIDDGLEREFFGRIKVLTNTKTYDFDDLKNILLYSSISPLKNFERTVKMFGYKSVIYTDEFIDEMCKKALEMGTNARALQTLMAGVQNIMLRDIINNTYDINEPIVVTEDLLHQYQKSLIRKY